MTTSRPEPSERLTIAPGIAIDPAELDFTFTRSGGPGGQNVNKVSTRATLHFNLDRSQSLTEQQKELIRRMLSTRINRAGILRVVSAQHRTQAANRAAAVERFRRLLADALRPRRARKPTRVSAAQKRSRREDKARRARVKDRRRAPEQGD